MGGAAQKSKFIVADAGDRCIWAQPHRQKRSLIKDCRLRMPWIGTGAGRNPVFMSANEVCVLVAMVMDVQARWGRCHHRQSK